MTQLQSLSAGSGFEEECDDIGLAYLNCDDCDDDQRKDLGCHRFNNKYTARNWIIIDYTGNEQYDRIKFCPRSMVDDEHTPEGSPLVSDVYEGMTKAKKIRAFGGPDRFEGEAPSDLAPRYGWFWATLEGVINRYNGEVRDAQHRLNKKVSASIHRRMQINRG